tara:strand:- start:8779 stop:10137 length:1359 start_codon:yes stop_codon:yes gene_type:complete
LFKKGLPNLEECSIGIIGLGYVGLPLALQIANKKKSLISKKRLKRKVLGFDIKKNRINQLEKGIDINKIFSKKKIHENKNIVFSNEEKSLKNIDIFIITVPTPIDIKNNPDLSYLKKASILVGKSIKDRNKNLSNPIIIYESTVYPGVTEEICVPLICAESGKTYNSKGYKNSFYVGYSPERINPGDSKHTIDSITKVTSGCNKKVANWVDNFYGSFISAGTFKTRSIKVAEAAKIIENTQRDINIALINELAILFKKLDINTTQVLEAADSKWNFQKYTPGLVGGHCIGVDPYYLTFKAKEIGFNTNLISAGRSINDSMHKYLLDEILSNLKKRKEFSLKEEVLILGISYKSNCGDIRNSQLILLVENFKKIGLKVTIVDPLVERNIVLKETGLKTLTSIPKKKKYGVIIFALNHRDFQKVNKKLLSKISFKDTLIIDLTNKLSGLNIVNL